MAGRTVLVTGGYRRHRQGDRPRPGRRWARTSRSPAGTAAAPRTPHARSARPAAGRWTCSSRTCPHRRRCGGWPTRYCERLPRLDVLVNNVGGYWNTRHVTADGLERTFALNHLAPFLLTNLLLDRLKQSAAGPSGHGRRPTRTPTGRIDFDDLQGERSYSGVRGLRPVQARERPVHLRAGPAAAGHLGHRQCPAPRRGEHRASGPRTPARIQRLLVPLAAAVHEDPRPGRRHVDPSGVRPGAASR